MSNDPQANCQCVPTSEHDHRCRCDCRDTPQTAQERRSETTTETGAILPPCLDRPAQAGKVDR